MNMRERGAIGLHNCGMPEHAHVESHVVRLFALRVEQLKLKVDGRLCDHRVWLHPDHGVSVRQRTALLVLESRSRTIARSRRGALWNARGFADRQSGAFRIIAGKR